MSDVQTRSGEFRKLHVARNADGFSGGGHARQTQPCGGQAFAHYRAGGGFGAVEDKTGDAGAVVDGLGVGHAAHSGEASASGGTRAGLDGFRGFLPGLSEMRVEVDEAWRDDQTGSVEYLRAVGRNFS